MICSGPHVCFQLMVNDALKCQWFKDMLCRLYSHVYYVFYYTKYCILNL